MTLRTLLLSLLFSLAAQAADTAPWPSLRSDHEMLEHLGTLEPEVPGLIEGIVNYETDPFDVMTRQAKLLEHLGHELPPPRERTEIEIRLGKAQTNVTDAAAIENLKAKLHTTFGDLGEGNLFDQLRPALTQHSSLPAALSEETFFLQLAKALPAELQKEAFRLPAEQKLSFLLTHSSPASIKAAFQQTKVQAAPTAESLSLVAKQLAARDQARRQLGALAFLLGPGAAEQADRAAVLNAIDALDEASVARITKDKDTAKKSVRSLLAKLAPQHDSAEIAHAIFEVSRKPFTGIAKPAAAATELAPTLRLVEKPPILAAWSGMIGNDSMTKNAGPYVNAPGERVWWIYDEKGQPRGYVLGEEAVADGQRVLHLTTINGPRVTEAHAQMILDAFSEAAPQLGVKKIMLPPTEKVFGSFNYAAVRNLVERLVANQPGVHLTYPDAELREKIGAFAAHPEYQSASARSAGVEFHRLPGQNPQLSVTVRPAPELHLAPRKFTRGEIALLALQMKNLGKQALSERTMHASGLSAEAIAKIESVVSNDRHLNTAAYLAEASKTFEKHDAFVDPALKKTKPLAFNSGLLKAPDAFAKANAERSTSAVLTLLDNEANPAVLREVIAKHGAALQQNERLQTYVTKLLTFDDEVGRGLDSIWQRIQLLQHAGMGIDKFPAAKEALLKIVNSGDYFNHGYYLKLGAAGTLIHEPAHFERAVQELLSLKYIAKGADPAGNELLNVVYRMNPQAVKRIAEEGAHSSYKFLAEGSRMAIPWLPESMLGHSCGELYRALHQIK